MSKNTDSYVTTSETNEKYYGVKGWLLILIIGMVFGTPLYNFYELLRMERILGGSNQIFEVYSTITVFAVIISEIIAIKSAIYLFNKDVRGIKFIKYYIYFWIGLSVVLIIIPEIGISSLIRNSIFAFIWLKYLKKSKRIKATFKVNQ